MDLSNFTRLNLFSRPTPLHELCRLREYLACKPRIFIKRDDLTESGLGGNKNRKLDFVMAEALLQSADVVITWAGVQSNHCRQTLAVAKHLGMDCHLFLSGDTPPVRQGNLLYFTILGAKIHLVPSDVDPTNQAYDLASDLRKKGHKPFVVPIGASTPLGALGYVESFQEAVEQGLSFGVKFDHVFAATGSAGTQAGIEVGTRELSPSTKMHGVSVSGYAEPQRKGVADIANATFDLLGIKRKINYENIIVYNDYYGERYGVPTQAGNDAIRLVAQTEGILLDPVYTGKAMSCMLDLLRSGKLDDAEAILFFHTGGYPAIFAFADYFQR